MARLDLFLRTWRPRVESKCTASAPAASNRGQLLSRRMTMRPVRHLTSPTAAPVPRPAPRSAPDPIPKSRRLFPPKDPARSTTPRKKKKPPVLSSQQGEAVDLILTNENIPARSATSPTSGKKKKLPVLSSQQSKAVDLMLTTNDNIIITAVAGAGKTTTTLQLATAMPQEKFIVMVYNHRLMEETNNKAKEFGMDNVLAFNYHSLGTRFYAPDCFNDTGLKRVVQEDLTPIKELPECDVLVLDEQQDMTPLLYLFICKFIHDVCAIRKAEGKIPYLRLVLMGDQKQELYGYNDADSRFLTLGDDEALFGRLTPPGSGWHRLSHTTSYRMTPEMVKFINKQVLKPEPGYELISGQEEGNPRPHYLVGDTYTDPLFDVLDMLKSGLKPDEILVLAASTKGRWAPVTQFANEIAHLGIPTLVASSDDEIRVTDRVHRGKMLISTYHQAKGIERDAAFVYNFDETYNKFYNKNPVSLDTAETPMYVAVTRAKKHLVLLHHYRESFLPFLELEMLGSTCNLDFRKHRELKHDEAQPVKEWEKKRPYSVTELLSHLPERVLSECIELLDGKEISPKRYRPGPASEIEVRNGLWELVSDITGTAIPAIYEWNTKKTCNAFWKVLHQFDPKLRKPNPVIELLRRNNEKYISKLEEIKKKVETEQLTEGDILYLANVSSAMMSGYIYKVLAIPLDSYTWFTPEHTKHVCSILGSQLKGVRGFHIEKELEHEFELLGVDGTTDKSHKVVGRLDICKVSERALWELKWTSTPRAEHYLQVALYGAIMEGQEIGKGKGLYNLVYMPTGQVIRILPKYKGAFGDILRKVMRAKTERQEGATPVLTDEEFLAEAGVSFKNVVGKFTMLPGLGPQ